jgi:hypothetical protein
MPVAHGEADRCDGKQRDAAECEEIGKVERELLVAAGDDDRPL